MADLDYLSDGEYTAVIDAIEDGVATVFFEQNGEDVGNAILDATKLPEKGRHADAILSAQISDGALIDIEYEPELTTERAEKAQDRFDRLSERPPSKDDS